MRGRNESLRAILEAGFADPDGERRQCAEAAPGIARPPVSFLVADEIAGGGRQAVHADPSEGAPNLRLRIRSNP